MNIKEQSIFGLYSQKENKVTTALLQILEMGGGKITPVGAKQVRNRHCF